MHRCVFCGKPAKTKEHIIPRWLQKHFDLKNQKLGLWNKTSISYCQGTVPACNTCNSEDFSQIEKKVRERRASKQELFIWALKIRYCLSIKDTTLLLNRKKPEEGPLLHEEQGNIGSEFIKETFANVGKKFFYRPYPFGSVWQFDNPVKDEGFGLVDIPHPYWALTIALPNNILLAVLFTDRGLVKKEITEKFKKKGGFKAFLRANEAETTKVFAQYFTFNLLCAQYNISNIPYGFRVKSDGIYSDKVPSKIQHREQLKEYVLRDISQICGLGEELGQEFYNRLPLERKGQHAAVRAAQNLRAAKQRRWAARYC